MALMDFNLKDVGGLFTSLREAITGKKIENPEKILIELNKLENEYIQAKSKVIVAEASSEHWIVSAWRPITMLIFVFIIANNYIIVPYATVVFGIKIPTLEIVPDMWNLLTMGIGGYIVGRSGEKISKNIKGK